MIATSNPDVGRLDVRMEDSDDAMESAPATTTFHTRSAQLREMKPPPSTEPNQYTQRSC